MISILVTDLRFTLPLKGIETSDSTHSLEEEEKWQENSKYIKTKKSNFVSD